MDKRGETFGQRSGDLWTRKCRLVIIKVETCGHESGELRTIKWRLVNMGVETCEHGSGDLWTKSNKISGKLTDSHIQTKANAFFKELPSLVLDSL